MSRPFTLDHLFLMTIMDTIKVVLISGGVLAGIVFLQNRKKKVTARWLLRSIGMVLFPVMILLWGYYRQHIGEHWEAPETLHYRMWEVYVLNGLVIFTIIAHFWYVWKSKHMVLPAVLWLLMILYITLDAWLKAGMIITGDSL